MIRVYKSHNENAMQLRRKNNGRQVFNDIINHNRLQNILRLLKYVTAEKRPRGRDSDKITPIRECLEL